MLYYFEEEVARSETSTVLKNDCESSCKFCIIHKYGVLVLNIGGFLVLILILIIYWRDIINSCTGQSKNQSLNTGEQPMSPGSPPSSFLANTNTNSKNAEPAATAPYPSQGYGAQPMMLQQPTPFGPMMTNQPTQPYMMINQPIPRSPQRTDINQAMSPRSNVLTTKTEQDAFKLPTADTSNSITPYQSTGSNYFKQMMRGKKQVASISQYALLKKQHKNKNKKDGDKEKGKEDGKKNHHRKHKS